MHRSTQHGYVWDVIDVIEIGDDAYDVLVRSALALHYSDPTMPFHKLARVISVCAA